LDPEDFNFQVLADLLSSYNITFDKFLECVHDNRGYIKAKSFEKEFEDEVYLDKDKWDKFINKLRKINILGGSIGDMGGRWAYDLYRIHFL